jgi:ketopantoate hydroxymethyltransferase
VRALGLKPQSVHKVGGFRVQGREEARPKQMTRDAQALETPAPTSCCSNAFRALGASITRSCACR